MKVLVADDDAINRRMLQQILTLWGYEVVLARDGTEAWNILRQDDAPKLAILDWMMPGMNGLDICREVRKRSGVSYIYILVLTANLEKTDIVTGMDAGADDYLTKPFDANELRVRLLAGQRILDLEQQLLEARNAMEYQAAHDSLTGLWNRKAILENLDGELIRSQRKGTPLAVLMADIDHFKEVNDAFGHLAGDTVLREVSQRLQSNLRPYDGLGRYGGEEFLLVASDAGVAAALDLAERLRASIASGAMKTEEGSAIVTLSVGVAVSGKSAIVNADVLLHAADVALYRAKRGGRNRVEMTCFGQELAPASEDPSSGVSALDYTAVLR